MIVLEELLAAPLREYAAQPEMDPLTEDDALQEAQLQECRFDAVRSVVGLIFDLRQALQLREGNTGVLVAHRVGELSWSAEPRTTIRTAWGVMGSRPRYRNNMFNLSLGISVGTRMTLSATHAEFYVGDVPGIGEAPPNFGDDDVTIRAGLANWCSAFQPVHAVFLDPAPTSN